MCVCMHMHACVCTSACTCVHMCTCECTCACVCVCVVKWSPKVIQSLHRMVLPGCHIPLQPPFRHTVPLDLPALPLPSSLSPSDLRVSKL